MPSHQAAEDTFLQRATGIIEKNLENEQFRVSELAREMNMSRSNLHRRVKSAAGTSVSQMIRNTRLEKAMELLKESDLTISEAAYRVGFSSTTYFSRCFHEYFGFPPGEAKEKHESASFHADPPDIPPGKTGTRMRSALPWMAAGLMVLIAATLYLVFARPFSGPDVASDVTIMVLPFRNDSPGTGDDYIINGLMEEILNKLTLMEDLDVVSRTTSESFRETRKNMREIADEVGVKYILEGSVQTASNRTRMRLQLIEPEADRQLWAKPFEREITLENIFEVQEEVALAVTRELTGILKPEEKRQIAQRPTDNLDAYRLYLKARDLIAMPYMKETYLNQVYAGKRLLEQAIALDPAFADAYTWIGHVYINMLYYTARWDNVEKAYAYMDSGYHYLEKALALEEDHPYPLKMKSTYFQRKGRPEEAEYYYRLARREGFQTYVEYQSDIDWNMEIERYYPALVSYFKFLELKPGDFPVQNYTLFDLYEIYSLTGYPGLARQVCEELLLRNGDSSDYYYGLHHIESWQGNYREAIRYGKLHAEVEDSIWSGASHVGRYYFYLKDFQTGLHWCKNYINHLKLLGEENEPGCFDGYILLLAGENELAEFNLEGDIARLTRKLQYTTWDPQFGNVHLHLARIYSMMGNKTKTLEHLGYLREYPGSDIRIINELKHWPTFDLVHETREFKEVLHHLETNFGREHNRIGKLLRKEGYI